MTDPLIRSWQFAWRAEGRSGKTLAEMTPFLLRFQEFLRCGDEAVHGDLAKATRSDCERFIAEHPSPFRANYCWRALRSFYGWRTHEEQCTNPMAKVKAPRVPLTDVKVADPAEIDRLLLACAPLRTMTNARDAAVISLLWATGLRRSELAALKVSDVDLDSQTLVVQRAKNGKSRRVPFDDRAAHHLLRYLSKRGVRPTDALWIGKRGPLRSDGIRRIIERRRRIAGVPDISAHAFRRGFAARALRAGVSHPSLMALAGWETAEMPNRYVRGVVTQLAHDEYRLRMA